MGNEAVRMANRRDWTPGEALDAPQGRLLLQRPVTQRAKTVASSSTITGTGRQTLWGYFRVSAKKCFIYDVLDIESRGCWTSLTEVTGSPAASRRANSESM